jgi:hypothetical protein
MNRTWAIVLIIIGSVVLVGLVFMAGLFFANNGLGVFGNQNYANQGYPMMGNGMMSGNFSSNIANSKPLSVDQAKKAIESYLGGLNNPDLQLKEIMIFSNNAYARIIEKSTGIGAMELLVDPTSLFVFPEYGANMMWSLKYGLMTSGRTGMMGGFNGMMGGGSINSGSASKTMTVTPGQAVNIAQNYLDTTFSGYQADPNPDPFYGYYTIDILKDGKPTGMLSVNGFSGQILFHSWHGTFIEQWEQAQ